MFLLGIKASAGLQIIVVTADTFIMPGLCLHCALEGCKAVSDVN